MSILGGADLYSQGNETSISDLNYRVHLIEKTLDQRAELFTKAEEIITTLQKICDEILKQNGVE